MANGWLKLNHLRQLGVDVYKVTLVPKTAADESDVDGKEDDHVRNGIRENASKRVDKELYVVGHKGQLAVGGIVLDRELVECLSEVFNGSNLRVRGLKDFETGFLKNPEKSQRSCDEAAKARATVETLSAENKMVQVIEDFLDSGDLDDSLGENNIELKILQLSKKPRVKPTRDVHNGGTVKTKSQETKELKAKSSNKSNVDKGGKEAGVEKELKAPEESDSGKKAKATEKSDPKRESKATEDSESRKKAKASGKSDAEQESEATEETESRNKANVTNEADSRKKAKATVESDAKIESKAEEVSEPRKKAKVTKESDSRKKVKATGKSDAKQKLKATGKSSSEKEAKVRVDESEVGKGTDNQEEKESSRPGSKNVRTCMTCGLQEPAPKVFKKCKRCKDEDCLNPPYYCGRDCQVLDWTGRHRQEHEKNCAGGVATS